MTGQHELEHRGDTYRSGAGGLDPDQAEAAMYRVAYERLWSRHTAFVKRVKAELQMLEDNHPLPHPAELFRRCHE